MRQSRLRKFTGRPTHPDIQKHQDVFRDARLRTWQRLIGPEVPAENNRSEREVRPIAPARKVSHGSQSEVGAENRGVFMSVLHTLKACGGDPAAQSLSSVARGDGILNRSQLCVRLRLR